ncbi:serine hydrolase [Porphyrobacter algicida]|uniref:Serine hydrolase n=1 Tax=Qipengyuania algicida TaxID=1836209 RepID=A0A845ARV3_9SPHN|nr:serine hydrolase [Qipengyuania algicida]MXP29618.1 serine hydrolase [Qipengyuania algicida]
MTCAIMALGLSACATNGNPRLSEAGPAATNSIDSAPVRDVVDYVHSQNTTGFLVMRHGRKLIAENWPAPADDKLFAIFDYGKAANGELLEDVASQQKSFVSVLVAIAIDKGMIDVSRPVDSYIGSGWSHATSEQEHAIRVIDVLTMSSGLDEKFAYKAPPGTKFFYNTAVYAISKKILAAASGLSLETMTREWLTGPLGMTDTAWRQRPAALAGVGNSTGLVTTPTDSAIFGQMVLHRGLAPTGKRIVSAASLQKMFVPSQTNPAYGRLWWLNGGSYFIGAYGARKSGMLVPAAPADMVAALGYLDRRVYIVPSLGLVIVRTGAAAKDKDFDQQLWTRLMRVPEVSG